MKLLSNMIFRCQPVCASVRSRGFSSGRKFHAGSAANAAEASKEFDVARRVVNLSAGCAALPLEVLKQAQSQFVDTNNFGLSVTEMGYRTQNFHDIYYAAADSFNSLMKVPDNYELHFFNGGATLQFSAIPLNLCKTKGETVNYIMNGHWSEKAVREARLMGCNAVESTWCPHGQGVYFTLPEVEEWNIEPSGKYIHFTMADTRQGFEFQDFPFDKMPENMPIACDNSVSLGSRPIDISKFGVLYAAAHKNFSTSGVCYTLIRKDLIPKDLDDVMPATPTMCNWNRFHTAPDKIWNVPVIFSVWLGKLMTDWMAKQGGLEYFEDLAIKRSNILYDFIEGSNGFYRTFVTDMRYRSRMQVVFTIGDGEGPNEELVEKFLHEADNEHGWLDIRSHPLGISSPAIRVTMYNPQPVEAIHEVRRVMHEFMKRHI